jgi:hypothetical protein
MGDSEAELVNVEDRGAKNPDMGSLDRVKGRASVVFRLAMLQSLAVAPQQLLREAARLDHDTGVEIE